MAFRCRREGLATSAAEAARLAQEIGYPVVLKIASTDILHKTEAGGVLTGLASAAAVEQGYNTILANARAYKADAHILGVQVQQMLPAAQEVIVGAVTDPSFGKLVAFGLGGVLVEVMQDITFRLAPATRRKQCPCSTISPEPRCYAAYGGPLASIVRPWAR